MLFVLLLKEPIMLSSNHKFCIATTFALALANFSTAVLADTHWQQDHPRREQVNNRLANQNRRIHQEVKEGEITKSQAASLHKDDHQIRQEEQDMASQNGGH